MPEVPTPVVFIHGLWLHATSWGPWMELFRDNGYEPIAPGWPNEPRTVAAAREHPELVADIGIDEAARHFVSIIEQLSAPPVIVGHSFGGLLAEKLLGEGVAAAAVAIDPAQIKGVLPLPLAQLRAGLPALGNPTNRNKAVSLTAKEFRFGFGNAVSEEESDALFERWTIPSPAKPLFQAAAANINPWSEAQVDTTNPRRGPMLIVSADSDHTVPWAIANAAYEKQKRNQGVTEIVKMPGRGHSLTIDAGWRDVAEKALEFVGRFTTITARVA